MGLPWVAKEWFFKVKTREIGQIIFSNCECLGHQEVALTVKQGHWASFICQKEWIGLTTKNLTERKEVAWRETLREFSWVLSGPFWGPSISSRACAEFQSEGKWCMNNWWLTDKVLTCLFLISYNMSEFKVITSIIYHHHTRAFQRSQWVREEGVGLLTSVLGMELLLI